MAETSTAASTARPTVIIDDVHVTYRVQGVSSGGGVSVPGTDAVAALRRIARRGPAPGVQYIKAVRGVSFVAREGDAPWRRKPRRQRTSRVLELWSVHQACERVPSGLRRLTRSPGQNALARDSPGGRMAR